MTDRLRIAHLRIAPQWAILRWAILTFTGPGCNPSIVAFVCLFFLLEHRSILIFSPRGINAYIFPIEITVKIYCMYTATVVKQ